ncbi:MAG: hypothetical protein NWQ31_13155, partial [Polaribacter sp.]|nr:hypothetical protein [Polaribacter sp.]
IATLKPNCDALIPVTYPPGPLPIIMMSYFISKFIMFKIVLNYVSTLLMFCQQQIYKFLL